MDQLEVVINERDRLDSICNELAEKVGSLQTLLEEMKQDPEMVTQSSYSQDSAQALEILQAAIGLKAHAGGAIKVEFKWDSQSPDSRKGVSSSHHQQESSVITKSCQDPT